MRPPPRAPQHIATSLGGAVTPEALSGFVRQRMDSEAAEDARAAAFVREAEGMMLWGTIGISYHMRPDGSVRANEWVRNSADPAEWVWREVPNQERVGAIKAAVKRIPELATLIPPSPGPEAECQVCRGSGRFSREGRTVYAGILCDSCFGVGYQVGAA